MSRSHVLVFACIASLCAAGAVSAGCGSVVSPQGDGGDNADGAPPDGPTIDADTGDERCLNGTDDDGDELADCADPKCAPVTACVASAGLQPGVIVGVDDPCPSSFDGGTLVLNRGLDAGTCSGCGCDPGSTSCYAFGEYYADVGACGIDGRPIGPITFDCVVWSELNDTYESFGGLANTMTVDSTCTANGVAAPTATAWQQSVKLCLASEVGAGCAEGLACVARRAPDVQCAVADGLGACDGYATQEDDWYTGLQDSRACSGCGCQAEGGNCDSVYVEVGSDYGCHESELIPPNTQSCFTSSVYTPGTRLVGEPTAPTSCAADATMTGEALPTGQRTLCCAPQ